MKKKFFVKISLLVVPIGILVMGMNYFVDPGNVFTAREYVSGIASILAKGHNVDNILNYDERLLQEQLIRQKQQPADVVILGSSRIMEISSDFVPGKTFWNLGVSHANVNDLIAITGILDSMKKLPKEIYINLDLLTIHRESTDEWQSIGNYRNYLLQKMGVPDFDKSYSAYKHKKTLALVSFEYFRESLTFASKGIDKKYHDVKKDTPLKGGRFSDGSIAYTYEYKHPDSQKIASRSVKMADDERKILFDDGKKAELLQLIDYLGQRSVKVHLIMVPYHPLYANRLNSYDSILQRKENEFRKIALDKKVPIIGGLNPSDFALYQKDFYDQYHCSQEGIRTFFK